MQGNNARCSDDPAGLDEGVEDHPGVAVDHHEGLVEWRHSGFAVG